MRLKATTILSAAALLTLALATAAPAAEAREYGPYYKVRVQKDAGGQPLLTDIPFGYRCFVAERSGQNPQVYVGSTLPEYWDGGVYLGCHALKKGVTCDGMGASAIIDTRETQGRLFVTAQCASYVHPATAAMYPPYAMGHSDSEWVGGVRESGSVLRCEILPASLQRGYVASCTYSVRGGHRWIDCQWDVADSTVRTSPSAETPSTDVDPASALAADATTGLPAGCGAAAAASLRAGCGDAASCGCAFGLAATTPLAGDAAARVNALAPVGLEEGGPTEVAFSGSCADPHGS